MKDEKVRPSKGAVARRLGVLFVLGLVVIAVVTMWWPADRHEAFRWFAGLGFPDVAGCKYVRFATGEQPAENDYTAGFLLGESNGTFTVLTKELGVEVFKTSPPEAPPHEKISLEIRDLEKDAKAYLKRLENRSEDDGRPLTERLEVFVLAWGCERHDHKSLNRKLFQHASSLDDDPGSETKLWGRLVEFVGRMMERRRYRPGMIDQLQQDIGREMMWRAVLGFSDPALSRGELLKQFDSIARNYPKCEHAERATEMTAMLQQMVREDESYETTRGQRALHTRDDRVGDLIFRLRDQTGHQLSQPGGSDIFSNDEGATNTPAHELLRIGYPAAPQLIAALDDKRLSRAVEFRRNFYFSHYVLTVGDCALAVLQRMSGRSFEASVTTSRSTDAQARDTKDRALEWWKAFSEKGEKQTLPESVALGNDDAPTQGELLIERYPSDAAAAIVQGARASTREWTRTGLIELAAKLNDDQTTRFLKEEMRAGPFLKTRVAAAWGLRRKGHRESIWVMIDEWERFPLSSEPDDANRLIDFLAGSDSEDAIRILQRNLGARSVKTRMKVVEALGERVGPFDEDPKLSPKTLTLIEEALVSALADTEEISLSGSWDGKSFSDPRISDFAGHFLGRRWPDRYVFDLSASLKVRETQRINCQNVWRGARNMDELPLPKQPRIRVAAKDAVQVTAIEWEQTGAKPPASFIAKVERLKGKQLTGSAFVELLTTFASGPGDLALSIKAIKDEDLTGVRIVIRLTPQAASQGRWDVYEAVSVGPENIHSASGSTTFDHYRTRQAWYDLVGGIGKAVAMSAETPFVIRVRISAAAQ